MSRMSKAGREILSSKPMSPAVGYKKVDSMRDRVRALVHSEHLRREAMKAGHETFEEADDFDTGEDDFDPKSPYEEVFDPGAAAEARAKPMPPKPKQVDDPPEEPEPKNKAVVKGKTFSGSNLKDLVTWLRGAKQEEVDELLKSEQK